MRFTDEAVTAIDEAKSRWLKEHAHNRGLGIHIINDIFGEACVYMNDHYVCKVTEMWKFANEMDALIGIVKDVVGVFEEV